MNDQTAVRDLANSRLTIFRQSVGCLQLRGKILVLLQTDNDWFIDVP